MTTTDERGVSLYVDEDGHEWPEDSLHLEGEEPREIPSAAPTVASSGDKHDPAVWLERATNLLAESLDKWEDEEESVKEEKADHITELNQFFDDWNANKPTPQADPAKYLEEMARFTIPGDPDVSYSIADATDEERCFYTMVRKARDTLAGKHVAG
jgi:hypothetical protein